MCYGCRIDKIKSSILRDQDNIECLNSIYKNEIVQFLISRNKYTLSTDKADLEIIEMYNEEAIYLREQNQLINYALEIGSIKSIKTLLGMKFNYNINDDEIPINMNIPNNVQINQVFRNKEKDHEIILAFKSAIYLGLNGHPKLLNRIFNQIYEINLPEDFIEDILKIYLDLDSLNIVND